MKTCKKVWASSYINIRNEPLLVIYCTTKLYTLSVTFKYHFIVYVYKYYKAVRHLMTLSL